MRRTMLALAAVAATLVAPRLGQAQDNGKGFLFDTPNASFTLRGGLAAPNARGDIYSFLTDQFTLGRKDFVAPNLDAELAFRLADRVDLAFAAGYSRSHKGTEFRHWLDNNNLPIEQSTALARIPLSANLKLYLTPTGRSIGSYAWVPARVAPYIGAGAGMMWYRLSQAGDFIDFNTTNVFPDQFRSSGWTKMAQVMAGADYTLNPRLAVTGDARYQWAKAPDLGADFVGFNGIDLSGFALTLGFKVRL